MESVLDLTKRTGALVWGPNGPSDKIFKQWCQGFQFSDYEPTALQQLDSGPCAVISAVQAAIFRHLLFTDSSQLPISADFDNVDLLAASLLEIIDTVSSYKQNRIFYLFYWDSDEEPSLLTRNEILFDTFLSCLRLVVSDTIDEINGIILSLIPKFQTTFGLLCFLYSALLTHGLEDLESEMLGETDALIDPTFGSASQCLLNLLITGRATPHLFDGERNLSGFGMQGITQQPKTGFLTVVEALRYCEVGWYLKNPSSPIWILGSETHFTVLASPKKDLVSMEDSLPTSLINPSDIPLRRPANLRQAERQFSRLNESLDAGFLPYDKFEILLGRLGLPSDSDSLAAAKRAIDPDDLGIILKEPFLAHYFADEFNREKNPLPEFRVIHYNGLARSNPDGKIRYRYGTAVVLDPLDVTKSPGTTSLDRCLQTKWSTLQVSWEGEPVPSLN